MNTFSIKKVHRMAALFVAIFCIVSIIPFSASASSCAHPDEMVTAEYTYAGNSKHHVTYYCLECGLNWQMTGITCSAYVVLGDKVCICGANYNDCAHSDSFKIEYKSLNNKYHIASLTCYVCGYYHLDDTYEISCNNTDGVCSDCGYVWSDLPDELECMHESTSKEMRYLGSSTHAYVTVCDDCSWEGPINPEPCEYGGSAGANVCSVCFHTRPASDSGESFECLHENSKSLYVSDNEGSHGHYFFCPDCRVAEFRGLNSCMFEKGKCRFCFFSKPDNFDDVPNNAYPAYVYLDTQGRWTVRSNYYFGGVNYLDLTLLTPYVHDKTHINVKSVGCNSITLTDRVGGVLSGNNKIVDVSLKGHDWFIDGQEYVFSYDFDSPADSTAVLSIKRSDGTRVFVQRGGSFIYSINDSYTLNFKANNSTSSGYVGEYDVRFYNISISPSYVDSYEPFGVRYFNNNLAYEDYQSLVKNLGKDLATYASALDYYAEIAYKNGSYRVFRDNVINNLGERLFPGFTILYNFQYDSVKEKTSVYYQLLDNLMIDSGGNYNIGYSDGYSAAVEDFEGVTEGGMVEGMINGTFSAVTKSWNILNSGVSISGISVGGVISSIVIIVVVYIALKLIAR